MRKILLLCLLLGACSVFSPAPQQIVYDLGPPSLDAIAAPVRLMGVSAPSWLDQPAMSYRLNYVDSQQRQVYRDSRWVAPPAELLAERLRQRLDTHEPARPLRLSLESFEQVFSAPEHSDVHVRVRAWMGGAATATCVFEAHMPGGADAAAGAQALARTSDLLIGEMLAWAAQVPQAPECGAQGRQSK